MPTRRVRELLGLSGIVPDPATARDLEEALQLCENAAEPRQISRRFRLDGLLLEGTTLSFSGQTAVEHLQGATDVAVLAVTLGPGIDRLLTRAGASRPGFTLILDAAANAMAEELMEDACSEIAAGAAAEGLCLHDRFAPGYGDLPLSLQGDLLRLLDAGRRMGLTVTSANLLLPGKSLTALMPLGRHPMAATGSPCADCAFAAGCRLRQSHSNMR